MTTLSVMENDVGLAENLRQRMVDVQLSQNKLAGRAGLSTTEVSRVLSGRHRPRWATLVKLADALGVPVEELDENPELTLPAPVQRFFLHDWPKLPQADRELLLAMLRLIERANHKRQYAAPVSPAVTAKVA